mmetsp:Transcript_18445/g.63517  ORF Transcript_18445/g.63517 Transcript_18445/m.63517 type:complete len:173 (+) Transcript_18445:75-593(+)
MSGSWECEDCLFANLSSSKTCGMCEAPRVEEEEKTPTAPNQRGDQDAAALSPAEADGATVAVDAAVGDVLDESTIQSSNGAVADENENENETISETASLNLQGAPDVPDDISEEGTQASRTGSLAPTMDSSVMAVADDLSDTQSLLSLRSARTGVGGSVLEEEEDDDEGDTE